MSGATAIHSIGGYEALAVAVVMQARKDSKRDDRARSWAMSVGPWLLAHIFDIEEGAIKQYIATSLPERDK